MYHISRFEDRVIMSLPVAPPADPRLENDLLRGMSRCGLEMDDADRLDEYAAALKKATPEEIELSRLQILHLMKMIEENAAAKYRDAGSLKEAEDLCQLAATVVDDVAADAEKLLKKASNSPNSKAALKRFTGAMHFLAQGMVFLQEIAETEPQNARQKAKQAEKYFDRLARKAEAFRDGVGRHYAHVRGEIPSKEAILSAARKTVHDDISPVPLLVPEQIGRTSANCGSRNVLWTVTQATDGNREEKHEKLRYRPLKASEAEELRDQAREILQAYNDTFNRTNGFIGTLKFIIGAIRYNGLGSIERSHNGKVGAEIRDFYRRVIEGPENFSIRREEAKEELEEALAELPDKASKSARYGHHRLAKANKLAASLEKLALRLKPLADTRPVLRITKDEATGIIVGRTEPATDRVVLIYPDHFVQDDQMRREAVYAMTVPAAEVEKGIPEFTKEFRDKYFGSATNFYNAAQAISDISCSEWVQNYFADGPLKVVDETLDAEEAPHPDAPTLQW